MCKLIFFTFLLGFNLAAQDLDEEDNKEAVEELIVEQASHFPGFSCQQELAAIESMAKAAIQSNNHEWALIAYVDLYKRNYDKSLKKTGFPMCSLAATNMRACVASITQGSGYLAACTGASALFCCFIGAIGCDNQIQNYNIEKILFKYLQAWFIDMPNAQFIELINDIKNKEISRYDDISEIFAEYPRLPVSPEAIISYRENIRRIRANSRANSCCL